MLTVKPPAGDEREGLREFLDMQREARIDKLQGVSARDARRTAIVSSLSLLSLIKHSAVWERRWFPVIVAGRTFPDEWPEVETEDGDQTFHPTAEATVETVVAYQIEETARHAGHADIICEAIDGSPGEWGQQGDVPLCSVGLDRPSTDSIRRR